jgi:hypothetical protein
VVDWAGWSGGVGLRELERGLGKEDDEGEGVVAAGVAWVVLAVRVGREPRAYGSAESMVFARGVCFLVFGVTGDTPCVCGSVLRLPWSLFGGFAVLSSKTAATRVDLSHHSQMHDRKSSSLL